MRGKIARSLIILLMVCFTTYAYAAEVYVIDIRNAIGKGLKEYINRGIDSAEKAGADAIIFDIYTPGGALDATRDIIQSVSTTIPTIAYVREAISAGAMISLACDQIVMRPDGIIGDAAPVIISGQEAGEKTVSYVRGRIRTSAEKQGRNPDIAAAMVDKDLVLVKKSGEIKALTSTEYDEEKEAGVDMEILVDSGKLLTLTTQDALDLKFVDAKANSIEELLMMYQIVEIDGQLMALTIDTVLDKVEELGENQVILITDLAGANIHEIKPTIAEKIAMSITRPEISSLLFMLGVLGLIIEIRTPGIGVPGIGGIICLGLFFGGHMFARVSAGYAAVAFVIGIGLLLLEVFVIPGFGVAGISGLILTFGSIIFIFGSFYDPSVAVFWVSAAFIVTIGLAIVLFYTLPKTSTVQKFVLSTSENKELGYSAHPDDRSEYVGKTGKTLTPLRPVGAAMIDGKRVDVVTEGELIERDTQIEVIRVEGNKIFVKPKEA